MENKDAVPVKKKSRSGRPVGGKAATEDRRLKVRSLKDAGATIQAIANMLQVSRFTVSADLKAIAEETRKAAVETDRFKEVGETLARFQDIESKALKEAAFVTDGDSKSKLEWLKLAMAARSKKIEVAMATGVIPTVNKDAAQDIVSEIAALNETELDKREKELLRKLGINTDSEDRPKENKNRKALDKAAEEKSRKLMEGEQIENSGVDYYFPEIPLEENIETVLGVHFTQKEIDELSGASIDVTEEKSE